MSARFYLLVVFSLTTSTNDEFKTLSEVLAEDGVEYWIGRRVDVGYYHHENLEGEVLMESLRGDCVRDE